MSVDGLAPIPHSTIIAGNLDGVYFRCEGCGSLLRFLILSNRCFHEFLANGIDVETRRKEGRIAGDKAWLVDFDRPENNDWLVVNQLAVIENGHSRRPDLVVFLNGLPVAVFELKNPCRGGSYHLDRLPATPNLPRRDTLPLPYQRAPRSL